ncbi:FUSC family protein [Campylobacter blaseri]|nr:FUSC family protein [Campylobacter blaseri]
MSLIYSENLNKTLISSTFTSIIIYASKDAFSGSIETFDLMAGFMLGSIIGISIRILNFTGYGEFTKKNFAIIINNLKLVNNSKNSYEFKFWQNKTVLLLENLKNIFSKQSVNYKDSSLIKNQTRALFYLYKMEEILYLISTIRIKYFSDNKRKILFKRLQNEIDYNLNELKNLFKNEPVNLKFDTYDRIKSLKEMPIFMASLDVLYNLFKIIVAGGEEKIVLKTRKNTFSMRKLKDSISLNNTLFQYSFKFAIAISSGVFITNFFNISKGMWVSLGVITVMRMKIDNIKLIIQDSVISTLFGIIVGISIVLLFQNSLFLFIIIPIVLFLLFYLKPFPYPVWNFSLIVAMTFLFSIISNNFSELIMFRFLSMCFGFAIALLISKLFWPIRSKDEIMPLFKQNITDLSKLMKDIATAENDINIRERIGTILKNLNEFNNIIKSSKKDSYQKLHDFSMNITLNLFRLTTYINSIKIENYDIIKNDLTILRRRFDMIDKKLNHLPYYFYENSSELFLNKDKRILLLMERIAKDQEDIYLFFN